jgi:hypothetical protein
MIASTHLFLAAMSSLLKSTGRFGAENAVAFGEECADLSARSASGQDSILSLLGVLRHRYARAQVFGTHREPGLFHRPAPHRELWPLARNWTVFTRPPEIAPTRRL